MLLLLLPPPSPQISIRRRRHLLRWLPPALPFGRESHRLPSRPLLRLTGCLDRHVLTGCPCCCQAAAAAAACCCRAACCAASCAASAAMCMLSSTRYPRGSPRPCSASEGPAAATGAAPRHTSPSYSTNSCTLQNATGSWSKYTNRLSPLLRQRVADRRHRRGAETRLPAVQHNLLRIAKLTGQDAVAARLAPALFLACSTPWRSTVIPRLSLTERRAGLAATGGGFMLHRGCPLLASRLAAQNSNPQPSALRLTCPGVMARIGCWNCTSSCASRTPPAPVAAAAASSAAPAPG